MNQETFLFEVDFHLFPDPSLSREIMELFDQKIDRLVWSIAQDGQIINVRFNKIPKKNMITNTEDDQTLSSLKLLPKFFTKRLSSGEKAAWRIQVYDKDFNETDWIILVEDKIYLESFHKAWKKVWENFKDLMLEVEKIQSSI